MRTTTGLADGDKHTTSPAFGRDGFEFRVRLSLQRVGRSVEISLLLEPGSDTMRVLQTSATSSLSFSLTIKNQKDDHLSITMDDEREVDAADLALTTHLDNLGFDHFMTLDLLMDTSAGYLSSDGVIVIAVRISAAPRNDASVGPLTFSANSPALNSPASVPASSATAPLGSPAPGCVVVRVACEDDLHRHVGPGIVDFGAVLELVVPEHMSAHALREVLAADLGFNPSTSAILPCVVPRGSGGGERQVEEDEVAQGGGGVGRSGMKLLRPLTELQMSRNSVGDLVRPLGSTECHLIVLPKASILPKASRIGGGGAEEEEGEGVMVFLKFYDPSSQSLEYIGNLMVLPSMMLSALGPLVNELIGLAPR